jgi:hypothetical protein
MPSTPTTTHPQLLLPHPQLLLQIVPVEIIQAMKTKLIIAYEIIIDIHKKNRVFFAT